MQAHDTAEVINRFNRGFQEHDPSVFVDLVADDCVMETIQPAPDGERHESYAANHRFWQQLAADRSVWFDIEDTVVMGEHATIRWRLNFNDGGSVRGVNLLRVRDGRIIEALAYAKSPGVAPLPGGPAVSSDSTRQVIERFHRAFEAHRPDDLDDLIGEACVLENTAPAPDGARYDGREACLAFWKGVASNASLAFEAEEIWVSGDRGTIRWRLCWGELDADRVRGVNIMRVRDGRIVEGMGYVKG
jgi:ketosteroid isomerase-like protein